MFVISRINLKSCYDIVGDKILAEGSKYTRMRIRNGIRSSAGIVADI